ncbi:MAG: exosortase K [Bacteroidales bacterium]
MRSSPGKLILYSVILLIFILLKWAGTMFSADDLRWLTAPVVFFIERIKGEYAVFMPGAGHFFPNSGIIIDKSCAGINFFILCAALLQILVVKYFHRIRYQIIGLAAAFLVSYFLTVTVSTARIVSSLITRELADRWLSDSLAGRVHEATGVTVVFTSLILIYISVDYFLKRKLNHEENC